MEYVAVPVEKGTKLYKVEVAGNLVAVDIPDYRKARDIGYTWAKENNFNIFTPIVSISYIVGHEPEDVLRERARRIHEE